MTYSFDLTEMDFLQLRELIHERFGIFFPDGKRSFIRMKLYPRVIGMGLGSFSEYFQLLELEDLGGKETARMISLLTNNETYFFREVPQLRAFCERILPRLQEQKRALDHKTIRILSAGCSTGEEVYTLAMLLFESGTLFWGWDCQIIGMDVDTSAVEWALGGIYHERSFRMTEQAYRKRFFVPNGEGLKAKQNIANFTAFTCGNIMDPAALVSFAPLDAIFCRNVLIYFSDDMVKLALGYFCQALAPGGYLLLGHSETLSGLTSDFEPVRCPEAIIYRKRKV